MITNTDTLFDENQRVIDKLLTSGTDAPTTANITDVQNVTTYKAERNFGGFRPIFGAVGFAGGVAYSFYKKTGFWKGFGISLIFGLASAGIGTGINYLTKK